MAPEQVRTVGDLGPQVDIWAFGVVAYECLTGKRPFDGPNAALLFKAILEAEHVPAHELESDLPESFETWFCKACAPEPSDRFRDARAAVTALETALGVLPVVGGAWMENTDPSISIRRRISDLNVVTVQEGQDAGLSLDGTATPVSSKAAAKRRAMVGVAAATLLVAVGVGVALGHRAPQQEPEASTAAASTTAEAVHAAPSASEAASAERATPEPVASTSAVPTDAAAPTPTVARRRAPRQPVTTATTAKPPPTKEPPADKPPATSEHPPATNKPPATSKTVSPLQLPPLGL